ncbi:MAG: hypothetical protein ACOH2M_07195 [Cypionkella sp.]
MIHAIEITLEGVPHKASYFVEHGVIHAHIDGRLLLSPLNGGDAAAMVAALLKGRATQEARKSRQAGMWREVRNQMPTVETASN